MIDAVRGRSCLVSSWRMSHLGMNPVNGGRPPRESSVIIAIVVIMGVFDQVRVSVLSFVEATFLNVRKVAVVMVIYRIRFRIARFGEYCMTIIIQPRWAIDEYARIFRSCVWFRPPHPPMMVEARPSIIIRVGFIIGLI